MESTSTQCQACRSAFSITPGERTHYQRFAVPDPTLCPACRSQQRLAHRNETMLYADQCDLCKKSIISQYSPDKSLTVYCRDCWWSDRWDPQTYGREFDFNRPFFEQWSEFIRQVPLINLLDMKSENSDYTNCVSNNKNCYLVFTSDFNENCLYSNWLEHCRDSMDSFKLNNSEQAYRCFFGDRLYHSQYLIKCFSAAESAFCYDCRNIQNCTLSWNLRNKQYCLLNQQYTKEEYETKVRELHLETRAGRTQALAQFNQLFKDQAIHHFRNQLGRIEQASGDYFRDVNNCTACFDVDEADNCYYVSNSIGLKDSSDCEYAGLGEDGYLNVETFPMPKHSMCTFGCYGGNDIFYSHSVMNSKYVLASAGLKKGEYIIFNKKYTPADYEQLTQRIREHMIKTGEWGQYFPIKYSLFAYNETNAQHWYPLMPAQVTERGWAWREPDVLTSQDIILPEQLSDTIKDVPDDIVKMAIQCATCQRPFRVVAAELNYYRAQQIPLPQQCYQCRYAARRAWHNSRTLERRQCDCLNIEHGHNGRCTTTFQTTFSAGQVKQVYCDDCYQQQIY